MQKTHTTESLPIEEDPFFAQDLQQMARANNYRRWQFEMIAPYVTGKVLEIGGGIGNFTPELARIAESVVSLEPNAYCHQQLVDKTKGFSNVTVRQMTAEVLDQKMPPDFRADTAVCMNVLEHIRDDEAALRIFSRRLKIGGTLALLIPAAPWLFGEIDRKLGHYRRYSKVSARALLAKTGLAAVKLRYFNFIGVWGWWWNARIARSKTQSDSQIHFFDNYIVPWQSRLEAILPPPMGQSLLVVARKDRG